MALLNQHSRYTSSIAKRNSRQRNYYLHWFWGLWLCVMSPALYADEPLLPVDQPTTNHDIHVGSFLVATQNLTGSSFQETVILITQYTKQGTAGIAINRPTTVKLKEAFPDDKHFASDKNDLFLGGPIRPDTIFVLLKSHRKQKDMTHIADDIYFSPGISAMIHGMEHSVKGDAARAYAGYTGWAAGQLEKEVHDGDWIVIQANTDIIFTEENDSIWKTLHKAWSGTWL